MPVALTDGGDVVLTLEFEAPVEADEIAEELRRMADRVEKADDARDELDGHTGPAHR